jgi:hypothetical protein
MAATLIFKHQGWDVVTSSWTAAVKPGKQVLLCYQWAGGFSRGQSSEGTVRVNLNITMDQFLDLIKDGGVVRVPTSST